MKSIKQVGMSVGDRMITDYNIDIKHGTRLTGKVLVCVDLKMVSLNVETGRAIFDVVTHLKQVDL